MKTPYILAISSFAVHGTASLKTFITMLGEKILPVPSLMLNGLTNMAMVKKLDVPFNELLQSTLELAVNRDLELVFYIGYLGKAEQVDFILEMINTYRSHIKTIITDPVCGDHGRKYVPDEIIERWPEIIRQSDVVFPNITELKLLTGNKPDADEPLEFYIHQFKKLFPLTLPVITSVKASDDAIGIISYGEEPYSYSHAVLPKNYGGSGDAFLSRFILNHFYEKHPFNAALKIAADETYRIIKNSIEKGSDELILTQPFTF